MEGAEDLLEENQTPNPSELPEATANVKAKPDSLAKRVRDDCVRTLLGQQNFVKTSIYNYVVMFGFLILLMIAFGTYPYKTSPYTILSIQMSDLGSKLNESNQRWVYNATLIVIGLLIPSFFASFYHANLRDLTKERGRLWMRIILILYMILAFLTCIGMIGVGVFCHRCWYSQTHNRFHFGFAGVAFGCFAGAIVFLIPVKIGRIVYRYAYPKIWQFVLTYVVFMFFAILALGIGKATWFKKHYKKDYPDTNPAANFMEWVFTFSLIAWAILETVFLPNEKKCGNKKHLDRPRVDKVTTKDEEAYFARQDDEEESDINNKFSQDDEQNLVV